MCFWSEKNTSAGVLITKGQKHAKRFLYKILLGFFVPSFCFYPIQSKTLADLWGAVT